MEKWLVYKIKRSDGLLYIGKTNYNRLKKRMYNHSKSQRFVNYNFEYEILFETVDHKIVLQKEKEYIQIYDTYYNGLNKSIDGSGNHNAPNFHTIGFSFSENSKQKMSHSHKKRFKNGAIPSMLGKKHSEEVKKEWSMKRKGKVWSKKFNDEIIKKLMLEYKRTPLQKTIISKNGKPLNHLRKFCNEHAEKYNMTSANMKKILSGKTLAWKHLYKEILDMKY
jgi:hypothetical protein